MDKNISEEIKEKIINEYLNTKRTLRKIADKYEIEFGDLIKILEEYRNTLTDGKSIKRKKIEITDELLEEIDELRKKGLSYMQITDKIGITNTKIKEAYETFLIKKMESEYWDRRVKIDQRSDESKEIDRKICELREKDLLSYEEIAKQLEKQGIVMTHQRVEQRYKRNSQINKKQMARMILKLEETRNASMDQMKNIAEYYGIDLEKFIDPLERE